MKLDRNTSPDGLGKYSLVINRTGAVDKGDTPESEFFVLKLKDKYAAAALDAYAKAAAADGETEFAQDVAVLADKARNHPSSKKPD